MRWRALPDYQCKCVNSTKEPRGHLIYAYFASTQVSFERGRLREILFRWQAAGARERRKYKWRLREEGGSRGVLNPLWYTRRSVKGTSLNPSKTRSRVEVKAHASTCTRYTTSRTPPSTFQHVSMRFGMYTLSPNMAECWEATRKRDREKREERTREGRKRCLDNGSSLRARHNLFVSPPSFYPPAFIFPALRRPPLDLINSVWASLSYVKSRPSRNLCIMPLETYFCVDIVYDKTAETGTLSLFLSLLRLSSGENRLPLRVAFEEAELFR